MSRASIPYWPPRFLSRDEAAEYVGVSPDVFDEWVATTALPQPRTRGEKQDLATWDRILLDLARKWRREGKLGSTTGDRECQTTEN